MKVCVTTAYDDAYEAMGGLCEESLAAYAAKHGLEIKVVRGRVGDRPPAWTKIKVIEGLFAYGCDFVLWVDADAVIVRDDIDIRTEIEPGKDLYLVKHLLEVHPMPGMKVLLDVPNTGVMLLRNCPWAADFLRQVWERDAYLHHRWWENAAVLEILGYHRLLEQTAINAPDPAVMDHVKWLDWNWNSVPGACDGGAPIIRHHTRATSYDERVAGMRSDLAQARGTP